MVWSLKALPADLHMHMPGCRACAAPPHRSSPPHVPCSHLQAVPANLTRYGLSQIINHLLNLGARLALRR